MATAVSSTSTSVLHRLKGVSDSDAMLGIGVVIILTIMLLPLPSHAIDVLLVINITLALVILLIVIYTISPLEFSIFPSLLLITTLYRLSLNVASTRLILLHGHEGTAAAGNVIRAFGYFVVGGNYLVGLVIFTILVIVNFIVITKGTERISEVAARFTLDGMPGKQMAIDADLNAGTIDEKEAIKRRENIMREADFYGTMDGASKFVRGDAIASILITFINILGGLGIGILQNRMNIMDALQNYTVLTIGEGLVAQIPALVISTSAGILVSRTATDLGMGHTFKSQFTVQPRPLVIAAGLLLALGIVPGFPAAPFIGVGSGLALIAYFLLKRGPKQTSDSSPVEAPTPGHPDEKSELPPPLDILELELGYALIPLVDESEKGDLLARIKAIRHQLAMDHGIVVPALHVRDNLQLKPAEYRLLLKGYPVARGELMPGHVLALSSGEEKVEMSGIATKDPAFGLPAKWIPESRQDEASRAGYTVVDTTTVVATHLSEVFKKHADELLTRQTTQQLLDNLSTTQPKLVEELTPGLLSLGAIQKVLQGLIREKVSIRDLQTICETLADYATLTKDPEILTEYVRQSLGRAITKPYETPDGILHVLTLQQELEERISRGVQKTEQGTILALEPGFLQRLIHSASNEIRKISNLGYHPVVLCTPAVRRHLRRMFERFLPEVAVIAHSELSGPVEIKSMGIIAINHAD